MHANALSAAARHFPPTFALMDHDGCSVDGSYFTGIHTLLFFGFTHCRIVCPRVLARLSGVLDRLGETADRVQAVYITLDPMRDTPDVLKRFLERQYPRFLGLTGAEQQISALRRTFQVYSGARLDGHGELVITHSTITYLLNATGSLVDHWLESASEDSLVLRLSRQLTG
jgi:protein SCO1/2